MNEGDLINGDCLNFLPKIPDNSIDLIAIDPPYEIGYAKWDAGMQWEILTEEFHRLLKSTGNLIVFQGWSNVSETKKVIETKFELKNWIAWDRIKGRGAKTNFASTREDILWFAKQPKGYTFNKVWSNTPKKTRGMGDKNGQRNRALTNVWYDISPIVPWSKERNGHPTQKPLALMERIVTIWSNPGDLVLDCFMGSGTTGKAAINLKRRFIGIEKDQTYFEKAQERIGIYIKNNLET